MMQTPDKKDPNAIYDKPFDLEKFKQLLCDLQKKKDFALAAKEFTQFVEDLSHERSICIAIRLPKKIETAEIALLLNKTVKELEDAVEAKNFDAMYVLALFIQNGWYKSLPKNQLISGNASQINNLQVCEVGAENNIIQKANKIKRAPEKSFNHIKAKTLFESAADNNHVFAQLWLGLLYYFEIDASPKYFDFLQNAANQNITTAQLYLGRCYATGRNVKLDKKKAQEFYEKCVKFLPNKALEEAAEEFMDDLKENGNTSAPFPRKTQITPSNINTQLNDGSPKEDILNFQKIPKSKNQQNRQLPTAATKDQTQETDGNTNAFFYNQQVYMVFPPENITPQTQELKKKSMN